jgi:hypothetical protein
MTLWSYSNNREWKQQVFKVFVQWEVVESSFFPEDQRVPREWAYMRGELVEAPELTDEQVDNIDAMIAFYKVEENQDKLDFDWLVTNENKRNVLRYNIPILDVPYLKVRKNKSQKPKEGSEAATRKGKEKD